MSRVEFGNAGPGSLRRLQIPVPNPGLQEWMVGSECRARIREITELVYVSYVNALPASEFDPKVPGSGERNLKRGAYWDVAIGDDFGTPRWFGYVGNNALSYRKKRGEPYPRFIEYGKPSRGIPGGHQLQRAAELIGGGLSDPAGINLPEGMSYVPSGRGSKVRGARGRFVSVSGSGKRK